MSVTRVRRPSMTEAVALSHVPDKAAGYLHSENMIGKASDGWTLGYISFHRRPGGVVMASLVLKHGVAQVGEAEGQRVVRLPGARVPKYKRQSRMTQSKRHAVRRERPAQ